MTENEFRDRELRPELDALPNCYYFIKEALSLRGIPDIIGVVNGTFFALEVKRSEAEANKKSGRIVLQRLVLSKIRRAGGCGHFVYPNNLDQVIAELQKIAHP